jgi:hypothetical protein
MPVKAFDRIVSGSTPPTGAFNIGKRRQLPAAVMAALDTLGMPAPPVGAKLSIADVDDCLKGISIQKRLEIKEVLHRFGLI